LVTHGGHSRSAPTKCEDGEPQNEASNGKGAGGQAPGAFLITDS
jgi:hypothetical protein